MRTSSLLASIAAVGLFSTGALAQSTVGGGASVSTPQGSVAGGASAGTMNKEQKRQERKRDRREPAAQGSSSSTHGSGSIYTDRNRATGGVTAGGTATGSGATSSSTAVDAYGSTDRNGSTGEVYGDSAADAAAPQR